MARDPELEIHREWIGYLQPVGLVVVPAALHACQAFPEKNCSSDQEILHGLCSPLSRDPDRLGFGSIQVLLTELCGWDKEVFHLPPEDGSLSLFLPAYPDDLISPTFGVKRLGGKESKTGSPWLLLIQKEEAGTDLDALPEEDSHKWHATPHNRFVRLLRETKVPIGIISNGTSIRLVYAPSGKSAGHLTFPLEAMLSVQGRLILGAFLMLLGKNRVFAVPEDLRLESILEKSREFQANVSTALANQVLAALYELVRGFQAADGRSQGVLLGETLNEAPEEIYDGLLTVLLRMVFVLFAEDRRLLSDDPVYQRNYSVGGLHERLRADAAQYPDTMDSRYGAWSQLLAVFRLIHDGASHGNLHLPPRKGELFDPDRFPFLEGRPRGSVRPREELLHPPLVPDGTIYRVLENLLVLNGERIAYSGLDVEEIGSIYESMMGFQLEKAKGPSLAIKPAKAHGAPYSINLQSLLDAKPADRNKVFESLSDQKLGRDADKLKTAQSIDEIAAAVMGRVDKAASPNILPKGSMILQPSMARRRSGSHYTPKAMTQPIVKAALEPVLAQFPNGLPTPEQILGLKVCDPAMGSAAFLVETCIQLADELVEAWKRTQSTPNIPPDETDQLHARRLIAQKCLYGVDKNPMAVHLAKLSLWLATLAKDHDFTFLDHNLKEGDSLVGLSKENIANFRWDPKLPGMTVPDVDQRIQYCINQRKEILNDNDTRPNSWKNQLLLVADDALSLPRTAGGLVLSAFFEEAKDKARLTLRDNRFGLLTHYLGREGVKVLPEVLKTIDGIGLKPFHWQIEFPEVFERENPGFDVIVGNPPFLGGSTISSNFGDSYRDWLLEASEESHGNADLVAHFFRRCFDLIRNFGTMGLIATNTIAQGDTRSTGLRWICNHGGKIYRANRRVKWVGLAAVIVSVIHIQKIEYNQKTKKNQKFKSAQNDLFENEIRKKNNVNLFPENVTKCILDGNSVEKITAFLFYKGSNDDPKKLIANNGLCFTGSKIYGNGFEFNDTNPKSTPIKQMIEIIEKDTKNKELIYPYIGGEEVNSNPDHSNNRYVINFGELSESEARKYPDLMKIIDEKVKHERINVKNEKTREKYWIYERTRHDLYKKIENLKNVLVASLHQPHWVIGRIPANVVFSHALGIFPFESYPPIAVLQSRIHELWARFLGSSMKDDLRYTPSDCFETFPFPKDYERNIHLDESGKAYYEFRADLMVKNNQGLTATYNRFHDPEERDPEILKLRELHGNMDRAVLEAYGWSDIPTHYEFLLDYEDEEEEGSRRKKPWRYRFPDEVRDDILARLLELNAQRAAEEAQS